MALMQAGFQAYDFNRMVVLFTIKSEQADIACAISTAAMDDIEGIKGVKPEQREAQFLRLQSKIEARAARKVLAVEFEGHPPGIILRSIDFRN